MRKLLAIAAIFALATGVILHAEGHEFGHMSIVRACVTEDAPGPCVWRADLRGNGRGRSFIRNSDNTVTYLN